MKKLFIVGNWKSNKTKVQAKEWLQEVHISQLVVYRDKKVIVCPPFTLLGKLAWGIEEYKLPIKIGAQDISPFDEGAYTGEVNGKQIKEFCDYVIIGHSERRKIFGETNEIIDQKIKKAIESELTPIVCISSLAQISKLKSQNYSSKLKEMEKTMIIAYEPLFAIGSGTADTPENANKVAKKIKEICNVPVIYGGSVTAKNVAQFTSMSAIDGVLVGGASLDPHIFASLIVNA